MSIPRRIRRRVPNLVPIDAAVWQLPKTWICDPLPPTPPPTPYPLPHPLPPTPYPLPPTPYPHTQCPFGYWGATWIQPVSIPKWIRRREPKLVPIGPAVWQLPKTFECSTTKTLQVPPPPLCLEGQFVWRIYPFPDGSQVSSLKSQVVSLQTANSWANAGVLLGDACIGSGVAFEAIKLLGWS